MKLIPQTFDTRPSAPPPASRPLEVDELMIDWGNLPSGSLGTIFWPAASASAVLGLADRRYAYHDLRASDPNTVRFPAHPGQTYVPIPLGTGPNLAGLLTFELPDTVRRGQRFSVVVRRLTTGRLPDDPPPIHSPAVGSPPARRASGSRAGSSRSPDTLPQPQPPSKTGPRQPIKLATFRAITGAFQVDIPVQPRELTLAYDENTLAIFKWRLSVLPHTNRWYPVLLRYIQTLSLKIAANGGDPGLVQPSPIGLGHSPGKPGHEHPPNDCDPRDVHHSQIVHGKVVKLFYDCFGDFEGFLLVCCSGERAFRHCERGLEHLLLRAMHDRAPIEVLIAHASGRIQGITLSS